jgi:hypothetical protein
VPLPHWQVPTSCWLCGRMMGCRRACPQHINLCARVLPCPTRTVKALFCETLGDGPTLSQNRNVTDFIGPATRDCHRIECMHCMTQMTNDKVLVTAFHHCVDGCDAAYALESAWETLPVVGQSAMPAWQPAILHMCALSQNRASRVMCHRIGSHLCCLLIL